MSAGDADAIAIIALIAAMADGRRQEEERAQLVRVADRVGGGDYGRLTGRVLSGSLRLKDVIGRLEDDESRREAFETALTICYADDVATPAEKAFLAELQASLGIDPAIAAHVERQAEALARGRSRGPAPAAAPPADAGREPESAGSPEEASDDLIMTTAVLAAALELLPQRLASLAIVPLQGRMVYRIGAAHGHELDARQVADLVAAMGLGAAAQMVEGTVRRLLGRAARLAGGALAGGVGKATASAALTFASTYALGHAARRYYDRGRQLDRGDLKDLFEQLREEGADLFAKVEHRVRAQAAAIDLDAVMERLRG